MFKSALISHKISLWLARIAIASFLILGTLSSLTMFHGNPLLAKLFHVVPEILAGCTIPFTVYSAFLLVRLNISSGKTLGVMMLVATLMYFLGSFWGSVAWLALPIILKWQINGFVNFLETEKLKQIQQETV